MNIKIKRNGLKLSNLKEKKEAIIKEIKCNDELKQRFYSFGIIKGANIFVKEVSLRNNTMVIDIENTEIAIRVEEAEQIEVDKI